MNSIVGKSLRGLVALTVAALTLPRASLLAQDGSARDIPPRVYIPLVSNRAALGVVPDEGSGDAEPAEGMAEADIPPAALVLRQILAQELGIDPADVAVLEAEPVEWSDSCLGVADRTALCAAVITPGYRIVLEVSGGRYVYHTDESGLCYQLVESPAVRVGAVFNGPWLT